MCVFRLPAVFLVLEVVTHPRCHRLYHCNPWVDTVQDGYSSFDQYLSNPTSFFMRRFTGMTLPVANFLVENVFCILGDPTDDSQRISAREFGIWVRDLPTLMVASQSVTHTHSRVPSTASIATGHPIASAPPSRRPSSRQPSIAGGPPATLRSHTRNASMDPVLDRDGSDSAVHPALEFVLDEDEEDEQQQRQERQQQEEHEAEVGRSPSPSLRSNSNTKRRKRGRKGKGVTPSIDHIQTSEFLASASQTLARELSRQTRSASASIQSFPDVPPPPPVPAPAPAATITKKPSRWKLAFGKSGSEATISTRSDSRGSDSNSGSARATKVSNLIMSLDAPAVPILSQSRSPPPPLSPSPLVETPARGRGEAQVQPQSRRPASPTSIRSGRPVASNSSSRNWRDSMASTNTSSTTFTRFSNQSMRSVSTFATSVSASSTSSNWRKHPDPVFPSSSSVASSNNGSQSGHFNGQPRRPPGNIKCTCFSVYAPHFWFTSVNWKTFSDDWRSMGAQWCAPPAPPEGYGHFWCTTTAIA